MHTVLNDLSIDILLIQEPWWGHIGITRSDTDADSVEVRGHTAHPDWVCHVPRFDGPRPKVLTYVRRSLGCLTLPTDDHDSSPFFGISCTFSDCTITFYNFYHDVPAKGHGLQPLFDWVDMDEAVIIAGDFNTHSPAWSPQGLTTSPWARCLERWMDDMGVTNLVGDGLVTRSRGTDRPSTLDLVLVTDPTLFSPHSPYNLTASFDTSSDHATLRWHMALKEHAPPP
jgi:hypothetical protein